jgi:hypothetical protein
MTPAKSFDERLFAVFAFGVLIFVDIAMKTAGFERFHRMIRSWPTRKTVERLDVIERTCEAVNRAAVYYFKSAWCLQRSATTVCLLRFKGIDARLVIGARRIPFYAHAWVEVDGRVVNDHPSVQQKYAALEQC